MIDFVLTENDQKILDHVRAEALVCRNYARHYDEHEEEFAPDELPEAKDFPDMGSLFMGRTEADTSMPIMTMLISAGQCWGDYTVRMRRGKGGLGNAALRAAVLVNLADAGYGDVQSAVWEKLCEVDGDNVIVDASFRVARAEEPAPVSAAPPPDAPSLGNAASQLSEDAKTGEGKEDGEGEPSEPPALDHGAASEDGAARTRAPASHWEGHRAGKVVRTVRRRKRPSCHTAPQSATSRGTSR